MSRASTRISIRWLPDPPIESTDTLVLSVGGYYVDLRVKKDDGTIDWLLAGERIVDPKDSTKVSFTHGIDSNHNPDDPHPAPDTGKFSKLPNGDDLEEGEMPNPEAGGKIMSYEEVWRELDWRVQSSNGVNWILETVDDRGVKDQPKLFLARLGKFFLAAIQTAKGSKPAFSALRKDFDNTSSSWKTTYDIGDSELADKHFNHFISIESDLAVGANHTVDEIRYIVRARSLE